MKKIQTLFMRAIEVEERSQELPVQGRERHLVVPQVRPECVWAQLDAFLEES